MTSRPRAATSLATNTALSLLLKRSSAFSRARCCMPASACTCLQSGRSHSRTPAIHAPRQAPKAWQGAEFLSGAEMEYFSSVHAIKRKKLTLHTLAHGS